MGLGRYPLRHATTTTLVLSLRSKPLKTFNGGENANALLAAGSARGRPVFHLALRANRFEIFSSGDSAEGLVAAGSARGRPRPQRVFSVASLPRTKTIYVRRDIPCHSGL